MPQSMELDCGMLSCNGTSDVVGVIKWLGLYKNITRVECKDKRILHRPRYGL